MKCSMMLAWAAALTVPAAATAQAGPSIAVNCGPDEAHLQPGATNLHGYWDFLMDVEGTPSFGLMAIGLVDGAWGRSLTPSRTAPVVLRRIALAGRNIHMEVATSGGDVRFDGKLSVEGDRMCGTVTYHDGRLFTMLAQRRPSAYSSQARSRTGG